MAKAAAQCGARETAPQHAHELERGGCSVAQFTGYVSGFRSRSELIGGSYVTVWDFRLERFDDHDVPQPRVPVALRGVTFDGAINDDDLVEVEGNWHEGKTLNVTTARNLTTAAEVIGHGPSSVLGSVGRVLLLVIGLAILALFLYLGYLVVTGYLKVF
jgi:hypothetical protein